MLNGNLFIQLDLSTRLLQISSAIIDVAGLNAEPFRNSRSIQACCSSKREYTKPSILDGLSNCLELSWPLGDNVRRAMTAVYPSLLLAADAAATRQKLHLGKSSCAPIHQLHHPLRQSGGLFFNSSQLRERERSGREGKPQSLGGCDKTFWYGDDAIKRPTPTSTLLPPPQPLLSSTQPTHGYATSPTPSQQIAYTRPQRKAIG